MRSGTDFASERAEPLGEREQAAFRDLAMALRAASWDVAMGVVETGLERDLIPSYAALGTIKRLANLPAFIGGLAMAISRPSVGRRRGTNPILARLARDHVIERERAGFSAREIVQEFLLLRRVMWRFVQQTVDPTLDATSVLRLEDLLNSILDEVIAECTVIYFDRATQELSERSRRDSLTGLLNHQAFNTRLDEEIDRARRYGSELQVIYFDLDDFKQINDVQGHHEGDRALVGLARIVLESIRDSDFAGRIGGDEFVIGLVESTDLAAHLLLDRVRARLAHAEAEDVVPTGTRISAGCAGFPAEADCAQDLLVVADRRLYDDKRLRKSDAGAGMLEQAASQAAAIEDPLGESMVVPVDVEADGADQLTVDGGGTSHGDDVLVDDPLGAIAHASDESHLPLPEDPETRRVVDEARRAIEAARRRATESPEELDS